MYMHKKKALALAYPYLWDRQFFYGLSENTD